MSIYIITFLAYLLIMKKILFILTILISSNVFADWFWIVSGGGAEFFVDPDTIEKNGEKVKVWQKNNAPPGLLFKSLIQLQEYDCKNKTHRSIQTSYYSQTDLKGLPIDTTGPENKPKYIPPGTLSDEVLKYVCK